MNGGACKISVDECTYVALILSNLRLTISQKGALIRIPITNDDRVGCFCPDPVWILILRPLELVPNPGRVLNFSLVNITFTVKCTCSYSESHEKCL